MAVLEHTPSIVRPKGTASLKIYLYYPRKSLEWKSGAVYTALKVTFSFFFMWYDNHKYALMFSTTMLNLSSDSSVMYVHTSLNLLLLSAVMPSSVVTAVY